MWIVCWFSLIQAARIHKELPRLGLSLLRLGGITLIITRKPTNRRRTKSILFSKENSRYKIPMKLKHEQIQYVEFLSQNLERIKTFYTKSFGWKFTDYGPEYTAFEGEAVDGGFTLGQPAHGSILVILYS